MEIYIYNIYCNICESEERGPFQVFRLHNDIDKLLSIAKFEKQAKKKKGGK